jgi:hypothetical protein
VADDQVSDASHAALLEELAALEHERWAHWQNYVHTQGQRRPDGSILLPANLVERWERQINTPYKDLTNEERESDREQVQRYFPLLTQWLSKQRATHGGNA